MVSHTYDGDMLVQRSSGSDNTMYLWESGRMVGVVDQNFSYRNQKIVYDDTDNISEAFGSAFLHDDDCQGLTLAPGADPLDITPRYSVEYDSAGRFVNAMGSDGDTIVITYLPSGQIGTLSTQGECSKAGDSSTVYIYNSNNLPVMTSTSVTSPREELFDPVRDPFDIELEYDQFDRLVTLTTTVFEPDDIQRVSQEVLTYNEEGLLARAASTKAAVSDTPGGTALSTSRAFDYEPQACVEQVFANPVDALLTNNQNAATIYEAGLCCRFVSDILN
ncbi:MAG: hypothetical protein AB8B87_02325 [Granulosicoccus sp.]